MITTSFIFSCARISGPPSMEEFATIFEKLSFLKRPLDAFSVPKLFPFKCQKYKFESSGIAMLGNPINNFFNASTFIKLAVSSIHMIWSIKYSLVSLF